MTFPHLSPNREAYLVRRIVLAYALDVEKHGYLVRFRKEYEAFADNNFSSLEAIEMITLLKVYSGVLDHIVEQINDNIRHGRPSSDTIAAISCQLAAMTTQSPEWYRAAITHLLSNLSFNFHVGFGPAP